MSEHNNLSPTYRQTCREALAQEQAASLAMTNEWAHVDRDRGHADWDQIYRALAQDLEQRHVRTSLTPRKTG